MEKTRLDELIDFIEGPMPPMEEWDSLPMLEQSVVRCTAKDRIAAYNQLKEYHKPKMQRTSINPNDTELPKDIYPNETGAKSYEFIHTGANFKDDSE